MTNATAIAEQLLAVKAIKLQPNAPFTWASGWKSPIYCDNRKVLSHPYQRDYIKSELCSVIFQEFGDIDAIAGVATAGIAWGALAADQLKYPYLYVRPKPKEHGLGNQIEGDISAVKRVLVVEDLVSTGKSSLQVCDVLLQQGVEVAGMVAIFTYGFKVASEAFEAAGIRLHTLTDYHTLLELGKQKGTIQEDEFKTLLNWRENPETWGR